MAKLTRIRITKVPSGLYGFSAKNNLWEVYDRKEQKHIADVSSLKEAKMIAQIIRKKKKM